MKCLGLFSLKNETKNFKLLSAAVVIDALRGSVRLSHRLETFFTTVSTHSVIVSAVRDFETAKNLI